MNQSTGISIGGKMGVNTSFPETGPQEDEIHIWMLSLNQPGTSIGNYERTLSTFELNRANAYQSIDLRTKYVLAHISLRFILGHYLDTEPHEIIYGYETHGKPYIIAPESQDLNFNMTYSQDRALIALMKGNSIGIDLEYYKDLSDVNQLVDRYFSPAERSYYYQLKPEDRLRAFYRGWTRKEAFIKALGSGLSFPLDSFTVTITPDEPVRLDNLKGDSPKRWQIYDLSELFPGKDYEAALAVEGNINHIVFREWIIDRLYKQDG